MQKTAGLKRSPFSAENSDCSRPGKEAQKKEDSMIKDKLTYAALYEGVNPGFPAAFAFLKEAMQKKKEIGRYELGGGVFALVQSYDSKSAENCKIEAHK